MMCADIRVTREHLGQRESNFVPLRKGDRNEVARGFN
jgi:hypothetical protein